MIAVGPSDVPFAPAMLETPGSLVWWYVDLVDDHGNGAVCIWSFGLPFLPGSVRRLVRARRSTLEHDPASISRSTKRVDRSSTPWSRSEPTRRAGMERRVSVRREHLRESVGGR